MSIRAELADAIVTELTNGRDVRHLVDSWLSKVSAEVFSDTGKWKYSVTLDYRNAPPGYLASHTNAVRALRQATENHTSGVTFRELPDGWFMFVPEPPEGYPAMAFGGRE
jgi:hypothetical protein